MITNLVQRWTQRQQGRDAKRASLMGVLAAFSDPRQVQADDLKAWRVYAGLNLSTQAKSLKLVARFFEALVRNGQLASNPARRVPPLPPAIADLGAPAIQAFDGFLHARCPNPHTYRAYTTAITQFFSWWTRPLEAVSLVRVAEWRDHLAELGLHPATIQARLSAVRGLFQALAEAGFLTGNPAAGVRTAKVVRLTPHHPPIANDTLVKMREQTAGEMPVDRRNRGLLALLERGLRVSEIHGLRVADLVEGHVRIRGKGGQHRTIRLGSAATAIHELVRLTGFEGSQPLVPALDPRGRSWQPQALSTRRMHHITRRLGGVTPHRFRATALTRAAQDHGILAAARLGGHRSLSTTARYVLTG